MGKKVEWLQRNALTIVLILVTIGLLVGTLFLTAYTSGTYWISSRTATNIELCTEDVGKIEESVGEMKTGVVGLVESIKEVDAAVAKVSEAVGDVDEEVKSVGNDVAGLEDNLSDVQEEMEKMQDALDGVEKDLADILRRL